MFPSDYSNARDEFLTAARTAHCQIESIPREQTGPAGEPLFTDVATLGPDDAQGCLLFTSALHGAEGPIGSALQCQLLRQLAENNSSVKVVCVHALNPYGFSWGRRVNENNIDLNRNFILHNEDRAAPPGYEILNPLLNPAVAPKRWDFYLLRLRAAAKQLGVHNMSRIIATGQYAFERGIFFGGHAPSETYRMLQQRLPQWISGGERLLHLDIHTGLGKSGAVQILPRDDAAPAQVKRIESIFKEHVLAHNTGGYHARGTFYPWLEEQAMQCGYSDEKVDSLCIEFGTYRQLTILRAFRRENQTHHFAPGTAADRAAKKRLREVFCPASNGWRRKTLLLGGRVVNEALDYLSQDATSNEL